MLVSNESLWALINSREPGEHHQKWCPGAGRTKTCWSQNRAARDEKLSLFSFLNSRCKTTTMTTLKIQYLIRKFLVSFGVAPPCNSVKHCLLAVAIVILYKGRNFESLPHKCVQWAKPSTRSTSLKYHIDHVPPCSDMFTGMRSWYLSSLLKSLFTDLPAFHSNSMTSLIHLVS